MGSPFDLPVVGDSYNFNSASLEFSEGQLIHYFRAVTPAIQFTPRAKLPLSPHSDFPAVTASHFPMHAHSILQSFYWKSTHLQSYRFGERTGGVACKCMGAL